MLVVLINTKKEFIIGELTGNLFTILQPWDDTENLKSGYNQNNIIDITYDAGTGDFDLSFNGVLVTTFRDDDAPFHTVGKNGYIVVISPMDNFPNIPVSLTFKKN
jgi:outer membrane translocation and assembly module TamA